MTLIINNNNKKSNSAVLKIEESLDSNCNRLKVYNNTSEITLRIYKEGLLKCEYYQKKGNVVWSEVIMLDFNNNTYFRDTRINIKHEKNELFLKEKSRVEAKTTQSNNEILTFLEKSYFKKEAEDKKEEITLNEPLFKALSQINEGNVFIELKDAINLAEDNKFYQFINGALDKENLEKINYLINSYNYNIEHKKAM